MTWGSQSNWLPGLGRALGYCASAPEECSRLVGLHNGCHSQCLLSEDSCLRKHSYLHGKTYKRRPQVLWFVWTVRSQVVAGLQVSWPDPISFLLTLCFVITYELWQGLFHTPPQCSIPWNCKPEWTLSEIASDHVFDHSNEKSKESGEDPRLCLIQGHLAGCNRTGMRSLSQTMPFPQLPHREMPKW